MNGGAGIYNPNSGIIDFGIRFTLSQIIGGACKFAISAVFRSINGENDEWRDSIWRMRDWILGY